MDVETVLNGHSPPTNSFAEPDPASHDSSNFAASMSNPERTMTSLPAKPPLPVATSEEAPAVQPPPDTIDTVDGPHPEQGALSLPSEKGHLDSSPTSTPDQPLNGISSSEVNVTISTPIEPSVQPTANITPLEPEPQLAPAPAPVALQESAPLPSVPFETRMAEAVPDPISSLSQPLEVSSLLSQPPTSDLRTSPSAANAVSTEDAMNIAPEKEQQELASEPAFREGLATNFQDFSNLPIQEMRDATPEPSQPLPIETGDKMDTTTDVHMTEATLLSPPPAPQPQPAILPLEQSQESAHPSAAVPVSKQPQAPAPTPTAPGPAADSFIDTPMADMSSPPVKIAREREDDEYDSEPLAKRARTEETTDQNDFKKPEVPSNTQSPAPNSTGVPSVPFTDEDASVTPLRLAHMKKIISNLKKSNASAFFRAPVDPVALGIPTYFDIIKTPMDIGTIDTKLKNGSYSDMHDFIADFELIVNNSAAFNGAEHAVTQSARKMQSSFNNQMTGLPKATIAETSKEEKRAHKLKSEPTRTAPPRRPSVSTASAPAGSARSPSGTGAGQTFAVGPEGVPLIRRDSTIQDGRPKRAIVPTKRNNEFGGGRPKKKKFELELRFCQEALKEVQNMKHWSINQFFLEPVDPVALNIPTYFQVIKKPMDLHTIQSKLENNVYEKAKDFEEDVRLIFKNCYKFNHEGEWVNQAGHKLEEVFDKKWATKEDWIDSRKPTSEPQSDDDEDDDEDEESEREEEDDESDDERQQKIIQLQKQIEAMSKQMGELAQPKKKKKSTPPVVPGKKSKSSKPSKKDRGSTFPNLKPREKDKKKSVSKSKPEKEKYVAVTLAEKQYISNGISQLPDKQMMEALKIIQQNVPALRNTHETEIELDIDEVPNHVLHKLLNFVKKYAGPPPEEVKHEPVYAASTGHGGVGRPKKSKPMSKELQEAQIEELKGRLGQYASGGSRGTGSPSDNVQSVEGNDSSDDDADSEESEEE